MAERPTETRQSLHSITSAIPSIRSRVPAVVGSGPLAGAWIRRLRLWLLCNEVDTPRDITASITGDDVIVLWRGDSTNVGAYVVERSVNNGPYEVIVFVGAGALPGDHSFAWADNNIDLSGKYCYRITAQHTDGRRGCPADPVCAAGCNGVPTPFDVVAIAWGANETRIRWNSDSTDVSEFNVERAVGGPFGFQQLASVPAGSQTGVQSFSYTDLTVQGGVLYCYRLVAKRPDGTLGCLTDPQCAGTMIY